MELQNTIISRANSRCGERRSCHSSPWSALHALPLPAGRNSEKSDRDQVYHIKTVEQNFPGFSSPCRAQHAQKFAETLLTLQKFCKSSEKSDHEHVDSI